MSVRITSAFALRVLRQLRRDPRTIGLIVGVPCVLVVLLQQLFGRNSPVFQEIGTPLLGLFPFITMFLVTSITMLRERTSGTLERLMTMPLHKSDIVAGYSIAFALVAVVQATLVSLLALGLLGLDVAGPNWLVVVLAVANAVLGSTLGLFVSAFAETEFQAVQFMPAVVFPQILLCGLFVARDEMATWLRVISYALPLTYAYDALARTAANDIHSVWFAVDCLVVIGCIVLAVALGAATLRRRTA
jgi:ABC-2 type transport system permease protein